MGENIGKLDLDQVKPQAIDFTLKDINGKSHTLSQYKGKIVLLNFWASWCPPCREEMPSMQKLFTSWDKNKYVMLAVNLKEDESAVKAFARQNNYTFPILLDRDGKVGHAYMVRGIPTTYLIDKDGKIVTRVVGSREWKLEDIR